MPAPWQPRYKLRLEAQGIKLEKVLAELRDVGYSVIKKGVDPMARDEMLRLWGELQAAPSTASGGLLRAECHNPAVYDVLYGQNMVDLATGALGSDTFKVYPGYCLVMQRGVEAAATAGAEPDEACAAADAGPWYQEFGAEGAPSPTSSATAGASSAGEDDVAASRGAASAGATALGVSTDPHAGLPGHTLGSLGAMALIATAEVAADVAPLVEVIPKSHLLGPLPHNVVASDGAAASYAMFSRTTASADLGVSAETEKPVAITLAPGDVLLHSMYLLKRELAPRQRRFAVQWAYQRADRATGCASDGHAVRSEDISHEIDSPDDWAALPYASR